MNLLGMLWGRTATLIVGVVGIIAVLAGLRHSIRKGAKNEMSQEIQDRTMERIRIAQRIARERGDPDRDSVIDRLREQGQLRD